MNEQLNLPENVDDLSFREGMSALDEIVSSLESNTLELEDSLVAYEKGIELLRNLKGRLDTAQQKIDVLMGELENPESDEIIDSTLHKA